MLLEELEKYGESDIYPFHMPGHKRRMSFPENAYRLDITEVEGFDNLHHASGILAEEQKKMADLVGARESFFLVNGSTCGILAAISSAVPRGGKILLARNSHKAAYHAVWLRQLSVSYVYPQISSYDIQGSILPENIENIIAADNTIKAVYITSPTYDGVVSDIKRIAQIVHRYGRILIVDEAHGAHFSYHPAFPESAAGLGADVVIQSVHKTLPAFTQSAVLHLCSDRIKKETIDQYLDIYESSSPSYILMAGISRLIPFLKEEGKVRFEMLAENLNCFYQKSRELKHLHVIQAEDFDRNSVYDRDFSKILISTRNCVMHGKELYDCLLSRYHLQMEMCTGEYVTALCSLMDSGAGFERLLEALFSIDATVQHVEKEKNDVISGIYSKKEQILSITEATERQVFSVGIEQSAGKISAEYVYLYPPGIPILVPGERIDEAFVKDAKRLKAQGLTLEGMKDFTGTSIEVLMGF